MKLRDGERLEIKALDYLEWPLQHWRMAVSAAFPLDRDTAWRLARSLKISNGLDAAARISPAHLLARSTETAPFLALRTVRKSRALFELEGCRAEATIARFLGGRFLTVGLEGKDRAAMLHALDELGLAALPNHHYGDALKPRRRDRITYLHDAKRYSV